MVSYVRRSPGCLPVLVSERGNGGVDEGSLAPQFVLHHQVGQGKLRCNARRIGSMNQASW